MLFRYSIISLIIFFSILSCKSEYTIDDAMRDTPAKHLENYMFDENSDLIDRINISKDIVLDAVQKMDQNFDYSFYELNTKERTLLKEYLSLLPSTYQDVMKERLIGIYFIQDFLGSGMADWVLAENGEIYTILILNPIVLDNSVSELLTYKENSCFSKEHQKYTVNVEVSDKISGLFYILMHESTHIVDYIKRLSPFVEPTMKELELVKKSVSPFTDQYWIDYREMNDFLTIDFQKQIHFYADSESDKIQNANMPGMYKELVTTPFASVYSYYSWAEDLAEYMTFYHFTQNLNMTYKITVAEDGIPLLEYEPFKNDLVLSRASKIDLKLE